MKKSLKLTFVVVSVLMLVCTAKAANTWYVDDDNYGKEGLTGKTAELAYGTIQDAINKASSGDTIYVAPGVYSNGTGSAVSSWGASRIGWNNKKLFIYSTGNASDTHIVGNKNPGTDIGTGEGAIRCLAIYDNSGTACAGTVIKGFTFRDGSTLTNSSNTYANRGGGVCVHHENIYFSDCVFTGCSAYNGSAAYNGTFVRCLFTQNVVSALSGASTVLGSSSHKVRIFGCVVHHNLWSKDNDSSDGTLLSYVMAVNCTIVDNAFKNCCGSNESFYNTIFYNSGAYGAESVFSNCVKDGDDIHPIMSTIIPDVRLLPGSAALTAGRGEHLSLLEIPEEIGFKDYGGNLPAMSGVIAVGATQTVGTPAAGGIAVKGGAICVNGTGLCRKDAYSYVFPDVYPTQYLFTAVAPEGKRLSHFHFYSHSAAAYDYRFPDRNDRLWVMPPSDPDMVITNYETVVRDITYVKPDADASVADGSESNPYRTLQAAVDAKPNTVIIAKAGVYAEGVTNDVTYGRSRLQTSKVTRITSEEGAEHTIIIGESDTSDEADEIGCGPKAVRCVAHVSNMTQIQGFTLTGGRTARTSVRTGQGGAVWSANNNLYIDDCIITNNYANANGIAFNARLTRCSVSENNHGRDFVAYGGSYCASVFVVNGGCYTKTGIFGGVPRLYHCTVIGEKISGLNPYSESNNDIQRYASVFFGGDAAGGNGISFGNVYGEFLTVGDVFAEVSDPLLADARNGDFHPFVSSPVFSAGVALTSENYGRDYWYYASTDFEGNPISFNQGKPVAGAFMKPTERSIVAVSATKGGISPAADRIAVAMDGECVLSVGSATRPVAAICVNGVTNAIDAADWTYSISADEAKGGIMVDVLYTNVWYAAVDGDDSKSGFFPDEAKTLQGALANANLLAGDRVVAMPGTYSTGKMIQDETCDIWSRAVVPAGVTLESKAGREATIIVGKQASQKDTAPNDGLDVRGLGLDAERCVLLMEGAALKGFTLTNGWTRAAKGGETISHGDADTCGGGVWCANADCMIEGCLFVGNGAYRGAGAFGGFCKNCIFADNYAFYGGGASSNCRNHGCFSYGNVAAVWSVNSGLFAVRDAVNCTCFDSLAQGVSAAVFCGVTNTVVTGYFNPNNMDGSKVSYSIFNEDGLVSIPDGYFSATTECCVTNSNALAFDENGCPEIGGNCCIDAGIHDVLNALPETDAQGGQRVYNGRLDIGAFEADWRGRYGRDIGSRMDVLSVSPSVFEQADGTVRILEEASLTGVLSGRGDKPYFADISIRVVSGSAKLTMGDSERLLAAGIYTIRVSVNPEGLPIHVAALSGIADILYAKVINGFAVLIR